MVEDYSVLLQLARDRNHCAAVDSASATQSALAVEGNLTRIREVNRIVAEHAANAGIEIDDMLVEIERFPARHDLRGIWGKPISGEMICPECRNGNLCYLLGRSGGAFVECSTAGCLSWDTRY